MGRQRLFTRIVLSISFMAFLSELFFVFFPFPFPAPIIKALQIPDVMTVNIAMVFVR